MPVLGEADLRHLLLHASARASVYNHPMKSLVKLTVSSMSDDAAAAAAVVIEAVEMVTAESETVTAESEGETAESDGNEGKTAERGGEGVTAESEGAPVPVPAPAPVPVPVPIPVPAPAPAATFQPRSVCSAEVKSAIPDLLAAERRRAVIETAEYIKAERLRRLHEYNEKNPDIHAQHSKRHYQENREEILAKRRAAYAAKKRK